MLLWANSNEHTRLLGVGDTITCFSLPHSWYNNEEAINALKLFLDAGKELDGIPTYRYDLVDLTRQTLSKLANEVYLSAVLAYGSRDSNSLNSHSRKFLQLIEDIDELLGSDDNFLLGTWLESAKRLAVNENESEQYEWNARTQVTMWYDNTKYKQSQLHDYANKFWSGLLKGYYLPRASMYLGGMAKSLEEKREFELTKWRREWIEYSNRWQRSRDSYSVEARGDALAIANSLYRKYFA
ncbi:hypothetical protein M569_15767 [Genlisea aurea]|uniref:Alpha-N-acetylglucosaminidase C-terminal domain-containing protein n=1 Tax=Genlisea aurea TaxID=192259 RepID=S8D8M1_9LAMI|nr:hypothetical protein M569_15767 [Genlisea aurea]